MSGKNQPEELKVTPDGKIIFPFEPTRTEVRLRILEALIEDPNVLGFFTPSDSLESFVSATNIMADRIINENPPQIIDESEEEE